MFKKITLASIAVCAAWMVLDYVLHSVILMSTYEATASLWRAPDEMKGGVMGLAMVISAVAFVTSYAYLVNPKSVRRGGLWGLLFGVSFGVSMGYGTYAVQPIPYKLAAAWFWGTLVEVTLAGLLVGLIVKD